MNSPETVRLLAADGSEPLPPSTPEAFRDRFHKQYAELAKVVASANIRIQ
jgi:hypothetical protein